MEQPIDYLVLGAGWGGLAAATLLAKAGRRVVVVEAQDRAGGCGQSFTRDGFSFCAEMQYLMGCGPGGVVDTWLRRLGLEREIEFNAFDRDGHDRIELPGLSFRIPNDPQRLLYALHLAFPEERERIDRLFDVLFAIDAENAGQVFEAKRLLRHPFRSKTTVLYGPWPTERVFDHFELSPRLRAVLAGQCGDVGLSPREQPFMALYSILFGYCASAHFPRRGMGHFVERVVECLHQQGGELHLGTRVLGLRRDGDRIVEVDTTRGPLVARSVISNLDPAVTMAMIEGAEVPRYELSGSCFTIFLGVEAELAERGYGRCNIWHYPSDDLDEALARSVVHHRFDDPFFFLSTPSLCADPGVLAPPGSTTVQINVGASYAHFAAAAERGEAEHAALRERVAAEILTAVERRLLPGLGQQCAVKEAWSPVDLAEHTGLPRGGMYGARLDFENRVLRRVSQRTALDNLWLTGATAGGPGLQGVVAASTRLVDRLLDGAAG